MDKLYTVTFEEIKATDVVCLNHYPYKPFIVMIKTNASVRLECRHPQPGSRVFFNDEFNVANYQLIKHNGNYHFDT